MLLSKEFLAPYKAAPDPFKSLLSRLIYRSKYQRKEDLDYWDTIRRVVEGNCAQDKTVTVDEAEFLYDSMYRQYCSAAGRGLYTAGTNITGDASYNCRITSIRGIEDWSWIFRILMCGSGVGVNITEIGSLPVVAHGYGNDKLSVFCDPKHPDFDEIKSDVPCVTGAACNYTVEDSREGWAEALHWTLIGAFQGTSVRLDVSKVRARGTPLITFGGIASGSAPLVTLCRKAYSIVRAARGRRLTEIEALDITTLIGLAVKAGNVRRAALLILGSMTNQEFLDAKLDYSEEKSNRQSANNSVGLFTKRDVDYLVSNSHEIADRVIYRGEPAFINIYRFRETDPNVIATNACSEIGDWYRGACCLGLLVLPNLVKLPQTHQHKITRAMIRYLLRERLNQHSDAISESVRKQTMRIGLSVTGVTDIDINEFNWKRHVSICDDESFRYATNLGVNVPIKTRCVQPAGTTGIYTNTSPGGNSTWSKYGIRRVRIGIEEPSAYQLISAGVPFEYCMYDQTQRTLAFEIPTYRESNSYAVNESARAQLERQLFLQENWADNSVSTTISFGKSEQSELASLISEFVPKLKCASFLPSDGGSYKQMPLESITEEEYRMRHAAINHDHPLNIESDDAVSFGECSGACPSR